MALHGCILSEIQAPPERRDVFSSELQRVGTEGAKVLRELGEKVKTMTKLSSQDILFEVHVAAEELQKKIDRRSYLLVNSESWEIGGRRQAPEGTNEFNDGNIKERENKHLGAKSHSETVLDLRSVQLFSKSWDDHSQNMGGNINPQNQQQGSIVGTPPESVFPFKSQISWPVRRSFNLDDMVVTEEEEEQKECKTYESASALSLATFASLLIEFVARLQNIVNAFEELSELAKFNEAVDEPGVEEAGILSRISSLLR
ncbi:aluminum-activated malate transporter 9-like isoform X3 [Iris pallida]|uniref:Aluminum-activated malate transporter 9-like isoform X3 n=1 Tax=Iris pallida TaxID=29817 RepID=A0AAX6I0Z1_IRIPA|nr:aluminum-activated malate transporter 9-like isoform X3 [Iris pallida]